MALGEDDHFIPTQLFFRPNFNLAINFYGYPSGYEVKSYRVCPMRWRARSIAPMPWQQLWSQMFCFEKDAPFGGL
jgi:hypothetical protein